MFFGYFFINQKYNIGIPCVIHEITGFYCPGCGITRCLFNLVKFNFVEAIHDNALVFFSLPFYLIYFINYNCITYLNMKNRFNGKKTKIFLYCYLALVLLFGVIRNINGFEFLRPI